MSTGTNAKAKSNTDRAAGTRTVGTTTSRSRGADPRGGAGERAGRPRPVQWSEVADAEVALLKRMGAVYVRRSEDNAVELLLHDLAVRSEADDEARAVIVAGPSGAGKTRLIRHAAGRDPRFSLDGRRPGMLRVQVPSPCTLAELGTRIAVAAGQPVRDGLGANAAWGIAMRTIQVKRIPYVWLDEFHNVTWTSDFKQARKIRNTMKTAMINVRHRVGLVLSGDTTILSFLQEDRHVMRRADVFQFLEVGEDRHRMVASTVRELAKEAGLGVPRDLLTGLVPRLLHAALGMFGTAVEMTRITIVGALRERDASGRPPGSLTLEHFATNWVRSTRANATANPFVNPRWREIDCAALVGRNRREPPTASGPRRRRSRR